MTTERTYTISVFSENRIGLLNKLTALFSRRRLNIESITISETERKGMSRHTITLIAERNVVENLVKQIRKLIEVFVVYGYDSDELIVSETALFKVSTKSLELGSSLHEVLHKIGSKVQLAFAGTSGPLDGLLADARYYSERVSQEALSRVGKLYPGAPNGGTVVAWLWA
ncbi:MAG TPA: acetolactate synthase small subunit, partial [Bacteroidia bacterium]|nr:acetolactate synthase small subunit [Bacteroidia bacterium]